MWCEETALSELLGRAEAIGIEVFLREDGSLGCIDQSKPPAPILKWCLMVKRAPEVLAYLQAQSHGEDTAD
jgi:hypothetical protein